MRKCIYCGKEKVHEDAVMDFCDDCGTKVWGQKMFATIKANYTKARDEDDLIHMDTSATLKSLRTDSTRERKAI